MKVVKGAAGVISGSILLAAGITNPIGWMVLGAAGVIAGGAFIMKRVAQHKAGKELVARKVEEYEKAYKEWKESGADYRITHAPPMLDPKYDPDQIKKSMWTTYAGLFKREMQEQRTVVALKLFEKAVNSEGNDEMEQIVTTMGFVIDKIEKTPTARQILKRLGG